MLVSMISIALLSPQTALVLVGGGLAALGMVRRKKFFSVRCGLFKVTAGDKPPADGQRALTSPRNITRQIAATISAITGRVAPITPAAASTIPTTPTTPATLPVTTRR